MNVLYCVEVARFSRRGSGCLLLSKTEKSIAKVLYLGGEQLAVYRLMLCFRDLIDISVHRF